MLLLTTEAVKTMHLDPLLPVHNIYFLNTVLHDLFLFILFDTIKIKCFNFQGGSYFVT